ncbi:MAG TPA: permease [Symbiobacteriaceae bacterium]|nr:permease [Symbiobacteriaceae bacterium]
MFIWAEWIAGLVVRVLGLDPGSHLGDAVNYFVYDVLKILVMLSVIIYLVTVIRSYFPPERTRELLARKNQWVGNILAALLGVVTPFCSCSAVPLFIGFVEAGIPVGVTFSFLIASPMVNEVAAVMLLGLLGWRIALLYVVTGLTVAVVSGLILARFRPERFVEPYVFEIRMGKADLAVPTWGGRHRDALQYTGQILRKVWPYVLVGIGVGAGIHGYAPQDWLAVNAGPDNWWSVPLAVIVGVPLYSNAAGIIPVVSALMDKGLPLGTVLAFMMAVTALSLPELVILRRVLMVRLLAIFVGVMTITIIGVGYLFNAIL